MTFLKPQSLNSSNTYLVVRNAVGMIVGQLVSDVITVESVFPEEAYGSGTDEGGAELFPSFTMRICVVRNANISVDAIYTVSDLAVRYGSDFYPLGVRPLKPDSNRNVCFLKVPISVPSIDIALVSRLEDYEDIEDLTDPEQIILIVTGCLYAAGAVVIVFLFLIVTRTLSFTLLCIQTFLLFLTRSVYFLMVAFRILSSGGLIDYTLVEVPTFFYLGAFLQISILCYFSVRYPAVTMEEKGRSGVWRYIFASIVCVWISFAAVVIAISNVTIAAIETRQCECRVSSSTPPGSAAMVIRIVYKSVILLISLLVVTAVVSWKGKLMAGGGGELFYQIFGFTACLFLNCLSFVIYYIIDDPSPYFAVTLWFTELIPVLCLLCLLALPEIRIWKNTTLHSLRTQISSNEYSSLLLSSPSREYTSASVNSEDTSASINSME